jgi:hypothetical protein
MNHRPPVTHAQNSEQRLSLAGTYYTLARILRTRNRQRGDRKLAACEMEKAESPHLSTLIALERILGISALGVSLRFVTGGSSMESRAN